MNENKKQCCKKHLKQESKKTTEENTKELDKMKEVISIEAGQNTEIVKENKETQN